MLFNSYIFVFLFLPLCLCGYFILGKYHKVSLQKSFLLAMSLWFYGFFNLNYLFLILLSIIVNFGVYKSFSFVKGRNRERIKYQIILFIGLLFNLGLLFYYKYTGFLIENFNYLFQTGFRVQRLVLPLGISFFTFQQISFVIDAYKEEVPEYSFLDYVIFVTYFPQLIAGPIVMHNELIPQFQDDNKRRVNWDNMAKGLFQFIGGLAKKVLVADLFGNIVNWGFADIGVLDTTNAILVMLSYTFQIYFDFSGYCDMACGIGWMMNIELPMNFNSPYKAINILDFWKRWHMTLTRFFTKYIYIPLGGNRKGEAVTYLNVFIVFLISGFWHGANWTFILWGGVHGLLSIITRFCQNRGVKLSKIFGWIVTFLFLNLSWVLFRAESILDAGKFYGKLFHFHFGWPNDEILSNFNLDTCGIILSKIFSITIPLKCFAIGVVIVFGMVILFLLLFANLGYQTKYFVPTRKTMLGIIVLSILSIISFSGMSIFLYFNF